MTPISYLPILLLAGLSVVFGAVSLLAAKFIRPAVPNAVKEAAYECGVEARGDTRGKISVHFYVIAVIFLIFDVETIFLFPWAVRYQVLGLFGFIEMFLFILILALAYAYAWRKGALEWVFSDERFGGL